MAMTTIRNHSNAGGDKDGGDETAIVVVPPPSSAPSLPPSSPSTTTTTTTTTMAAIVAAAVAAAAANNNNNNNTHNSHANDIDAEDALATKIAAAEASKSKGTTAKTTIANDERRRSEGLSGEKTTASVIDPQQPSTSSAAAAGVNGASARGEGDIRPICCVLTKQADSSISPCGRFAFVPLAQELVDTAARKNLPLYCDARAKIHLVCLFHRRLINSTAKFSDAFYRTSFAQYEVSEERQLQEFLDDYCRYEAAETRKRQQRQRQDGGDDAEVIVEELSERQAQLRKRQFTEAVQRILNRYRSYEDVYEPSASTSTANHSPNKHGGASKSMRKGLNGDGNNTEIKLHALSPFSLKRYKKFFKLPQRMGPKAQLVESVREHLESIPLDQSETAAYFLYALKHRKNSLDHHHHHTTHQQAAAPSSPRSQNTANHNSLISNNNHYGGANDRR